MTEQEQKEGQKTVVAFVAGLLIGGLLVWIFSGDKQESPKETMQDDGSAMMDDSGDTMSDNASGDTMGDAMTADKSMETSSTATMHVGTGAVKVADQSAGMKVELGSATFPTDEGWVAVRTYSNGQLGSILGAARYSKEQGLIPEMVELLAPTTAGNEYAVVFFTENGDHVFDLATDAQIDGTLETFTAK